MALRIGSSSKPRFLPSLGIFESSLTSTASTPGSDANRLLGFTLDLRFERASGRSQHNGKADPPAFDLDIMDHIQGDQIPVQLWLLNSAQCSQHTFFGNLILFYHSTLSKTLYHIKVKRSIHWFMGSISPGSFFLCVILRPDTGVVRDRF